MANNTLNVCFSQKTHNWITPKEVFEPLNKEFGLVIDPCTFPNNPLKLLIFFTEADNGLMQDWTMNAFVNPPYGKLSRPFVEKAIAESKRFGTTNVLLLPARTDTKLFHDLLYKKPNIEIRFIKGRVKFEGVALDYKRNSAPFPSMIVIVRQPSFAKVKYADLQEEYGVVP